MCHEIGENDMAYEYHALFKDRVRTRMDGETARKIMAVEAKELLI